ncbi:hypothetical protein [Sulfoacidibacillus thermotolerans]|uniref:Lipoprotein SmpA/OmlA domain-containing protein n=1 Tax=Sulfoacidibacillus thermotolerans TaxID=1765684 RepID=A0A2U3D1N8_SULT2|nr:hypothetical protein [Sulfoacidibacillus thermotolerans]PWI55177.1 hypothetical protein BM613_13370 [Sulfoacidibacillus thermotolerans]
MKRSLALTTMILGAVWLTGCGTANASTNTTSSQHKTTVTTTNRQLTKSDMKIGKLYIGQQLSDVQAMYGKPSTKTIVHGNGAPQWEYSKKGFVVGGNPVFTIMVSGQFLGSTPRGIHIGSTEEAVKKSYPTYKMVQGGSQLFVESSNKEFSMDFGLKDGKVTRIILTNENP